MPVEMNRAVRPSMGGGEGLQSVTIDFADNGGVVVRCTPKMKNKGGGQAPMYQEPQQHVFGSLKEGLDYVEQKAGGAGSEPETTLPEAKGAAPVNPSADQDADDEPFDA